MSEELASYRSGEKPVFVDASRVAVFTDLHLEPNRYHEIVAFVYSLMDLKGQADALVILGDLFESYVGREDFLHPAFDPMLQAFNQLRESGCELYLVRGNRDVLLSPSDGRHLGFTVADSIFCRSIPGGLLLTHGDAFCLGDLPYQRLRRILRFPGIRPMLRSLPGWLRRRLAGRLRSYSVQEVARKPMDSMKLTLSMVDTVMIQEGAEQAWIGHLHQFQEFDLESGRHLRVLPAWEPNSSPWWITEKLDDSVKNAKISRLDGHGSANSENMVITVDGSSGSGKSTLSKRLAIELGWPFLDSGAWYRALTWVILKADQNPSDAQAVLKTLSSIQILSDNQGQVSIDGVELGDCLRTPQIDQAVSQVADHFAVRAALNERMRALASSLTVQGVVADGRDAGTIIFPDANLKIFVEASLDVRAKRRFEQMSTKGIETTLQEVHQALAVRDAHDAARGDAAPHPTAQSRILNNNNQTVEEAVGCLLSWVNQLNLS